MCEKKKKLGGLLLCSRRMRNGREETDKVRI